MPVQPIKPSKVARQKLQNIPDGVFEAFNEMIAQHFASGVATFTQKAVVARMVGKGLKSKNIFANHWLDVEPLYEEAGWSVEYDTPGFNETGNAIFTFKTKRK